MRHRAFIILIINTLLLLSCHQQKHEPTKNTGKIAGIVFCIDDSYVKDFYQTNHYQYIQSTGIKMTYFITRYHKLKRGEKSIIKIFQADGHEIGFHGTHHIHAREYLEQHTIDEYINYEIKPDLKKMKDDGLDVTDFSYPYGSHTPELDSVLFHKYFYFIMIFSHNPYHYYNLETEKSYIIPFPLDERYWITYYRGLDVHKALAYIDSAYKQNKVAVFFGHGLSDEYNTERNAIWFDKFRLIMDYAKEKGMKFYTLNDLKKFGNKDLILSFDGESYEIDDE